MSPIVRKYGRIFRVSLIERLHYRGDFFFSTILRFLPNAAARDVAKVLKSGPYTAGVSTHFGPARPNSGSEG